MKPLMKKLVLTMAAVSLLILGGCSSNDQKNDKKGSDSETKKEEVKIIKNDGFTFKVSVSYAKTDLKESALKKEMRIKVMKIMDYDFNRSYDYTKRNLVFEGEMKSVYRVLAVE